MKATSRNSVHRRGASLVELLMATAVGTIVLAATLAVFDASRAAQASSERLIATYQSLSLGVLGMQREMENVGYKFPDQSIFFFNNVAAGTTFTMGHGGGTNLQVVAPGANGAGIVAGTDVVEFFVGDETRRVGTVLAVADVGINRNVTFDSVEPITAMEDSQFPSKQGPMLVFTDGTTSCLGLAYNRGPGYPSPLNFLVRIQRNDGDHPNPPPGCPAAGMRIFAISERRRYMVYQQAGGADTGLYVQVSLPNAGSFQNAGTFGPPMLMVRGVEDLQISPTMANQANALGCGRVTCQCNDGTGGCDGTLPVNQRLFRGIRVRLLSQGTEPIRKMGERRPALYDHPAGPVDNIERNVMEASIEFPNLNPSMVDPI